MAVFTAIAGAIATISSWTISLGALGSFAIGNFLLRAAVQLGVSALAKAFAKKGAQSEPFAIQGQVRTGGSVPRSFVMGPALSAGSLVWHSEWGTAGGTPNAYYTQVIALSDLPVAGLHRWFIEGRAVTLEDTGDERGLAAVEYREGGEDHAWIRFHDGNQTVADPFLTGTVNNGAPRAYSSSRIGTGIAYAVVTFRVNQEIFTGFPRSKFVLNGVKLYDVSKDSTRGGTGAQRWDDPATWGGDGDALPAVQAYNLARGITFGGKWFYGLQGLTAARLPAAHWIAQVEKCRAAIDGEDGPEPIYRCAGEITVNSEIGSAFEAILTACAGRMSEVGGIFKIYVGAPDAPIASVTDEDIVSLAPQTFTPFYGLSDTVNGVIASYPSPDEGYVMRSTPPLYNADFEAEDGGRRLMTDVQLSFVPFPAQAQRLLAGELAAARRARRHTFTLPARFRLIEPGDVVTWDSERNGYAAKQFRVDGVIDLPNCDLIVDLTEVDPADHGGWNHAGDYVPVTPSPVLPVVPSVQGVIGFNPVAADIQDAAGTARRPGLLMQWNGDVEDIAGIQFEVRVKATAAVVSTAETRTFDAAKLPIEAGLVASTVYEARARYIPGAPRAVAWTSWVEVSTNDVRFGVGDFGPDAIEWSALAQEVRDQVDSAGDANLSAQAAQAARAGALSSEAAAEAARLGAETAEGNAAGSASAAASSASAASASETAAGSSASAAESSRLEAEVSGRAAAEGADAAALGSLVRNGAFREDVEFWSAPYGDSEIKWVADTDNSAKLTSGCAELTMPSGGSHGYFFSTNAAGDFVDLPLAIDAGRRIRARFFARMRPGYSVPLEVRFSINGKRDSGGDGWVTTANSPLLSGDWVEVTVDAVAEYRIGRRLRPYILVLSAPGSDGEKVQISDLTVVDITDAFNAAGSASAAASSASAASASETAAGSSASAAETSRLAAETAEGNAAGSASAAASSASAASASQTAAGSSASAAESSRLAADAGAAAAELSAAALFPADFREDGRYFTRSQVGLNAPALPAGVVIDVPGVGPVAQSVGFLFVQPRGYVPAVPGRVYEWRAVVRATVDNTISGGGERIVLSATLMDDFGALVSYAGAAPDGEVNAREPLRVADGWVELACRVAVPASPNFSYIRPRLNNGWLSGGPNGDAVWQVRSFTCRDVTEADAAAGSASAAASSASAASASETAAEQSASSASQSANTAGTAASGASASQTAAAQSATDAAGSASAAAQSATVASQTLTQFQLEHTDFQRVLDGVAAVDTVGALETAAEGGSVLGQGGSVISATGSGSIDTSGSTNGLSIKITQEQSLQFSGRRVRVDILAKQPASTPAARFIAAYSTADNGNSGQNVFDLTASWAWHSFYYTLPVANSGGNDFIGLWGDQSQTGKKTQFGRVIVRPAPLAEDIPEIGIVQAEATAASQAVTDLEGNAAASLVFRAKAGAAAGSVEIAAFQNADGGAASKVKLTGAEIEFDGLSVFGDSLQSDDFSAGSAGWRIQKNGSAEFNQLIVRDSIVDGAVSNGGIYLGNASPTTVGGGVGLGWLTLGAFSQGEFWQIAARLKYRMWGKIDTSYNTSKVGWVYQHKKVYTKPALQWRTKSAGVWSSWSDLEVFPQAASTTWIEHDTVVSKQGIFEDVQIRILINHVQSGNQNGAQSATYTNVHETSYVARALVR